MTNSDQPLILIVEDDVVTQSLYRHILEAKGYKTITCTSLAKAAALTYQYTPQLAILDIIIDETHVSGLNGIDVGRIALKINPDTKLIFISSQDEMLSWLDGFDVPYSDRKLKPVTPTELLDMVEKALNKP